MKYPIPRPKKIFFNERAIAASFAAADFDPIFAPALKVFQDYARRAFGSIESFG